MMLASTKNVVGLFNGTNGALWFDQTFALFSNLKECFSPTRSATCADRNSMFYAVTAGVEQPRLPCWPATASRSSGLPVGG